MKRVIRNADVVELVVEVPTGHRHLRATVRLVDGTELELQEATVANLVRAYVGVKTHPIRTRLRLVGRTMGTRKDDYAEWQLVEEADD